eukprot:c20017_g1_i5.p1 GENE.c20017_g1_i5~~c20017_g1_i5.p1  ORF type:complete len:741 (+),score=229.74 c20017_g1_i5:280-2223(+)
MAEHIDFLERQNADFKQRELETMKSLSQAESTLETKTAENERMKEQIAALRAERIQQASSAVVVGSEGEAEALRDQAKRLAELEMDIQDKLVEMQQLRAAVATEKTEHSKTKQVLTEKQALLNQIQEIQVQQDTETREATTFLREQLQTLGQQLAAAKSREQDSERQHKELLESWRSLEVERNQLSIDLEHVMKSEKTLGERYAKLEDDCDNLRAKIDKHEVDNAALKRELGAARLETHRAETEVFKKTEELRTMEGELAKLRSDCEDFSEKIATVENANLPKVVRGLQSDLEAKQQELDQSNAEVGRLTAVVAQLHDTISAGERAIETVREEHKAEVLRWEMKVRATEDTLEQVRAELQLKHDHIAQLKVDELKEQLAEMDQLEQRNQDLTEKGRELTSTISKLEVEHKAAVAQLEEQLQERLIMEKRQAHTVRDLQQEVRKMTATIVQLTEDRDAARTLVEATTREVEELRQAVPPPQPEVEEPQETEEYQEQPPPPEVDTARILEKLLQTQADNVQLMERISLQEESLQQLSDDCQMKTVIIREMLRKGQTYLTAEDLALPEPMQDPSDTSPGPNPSTPVRQGSEGMMMMAARALRNGVVSRVQVERQRKMEDVMEDLLLKNINLQKALDEAVRQNQARQEAES